MGETSNSLLDRIHSWAKAHASNRTASSGDSRRNSILPVANEPSTATRNGTSLSPSRPATADANDTRDNNGVGTGTTANDVADIRSSAHPPPAPPPNKSQAEGEKSATVENGTAVEKPPIPKRMRNGIVRFGVHTKDAITHSWVNWLLVFVPLGIAVQAAGLSPAIIFAMNAVAVIPLAGLLAHATESVASRLGDTWGALLNVTFGNSVELIIFIIALVKDEIRIVQASILGSILANLLLILGMAFLFGGLRFQEQVYNSTVTQMSACLLSLSVMSLLLPTAFHASFASTDTADARTLKISRGTSVVLLIVYILYLLFQLKSHAYLYASTPQAIIDEETHPGILADVLNSSSSSDSSSSSSSGDSDSSNGSHTTAGKIKRAFRHRKRRKSSASSNPAPSVISSPTIESTRFDDDSGPESRNRHEFALGDIASGDEADAENVGRNTRVRDFSTKASGSQSSPEQHRSPEGRRKKKKRDKKREKRERREERRRRRAEERRAQEVQASIPEQELPGPRVAWTDQENQDSDASHANRSSRIPLASSLRPTLPKVLSQTVFSSPPPNGSPSMRPSPNIRPNPPRSGSGIPNPGSGLRRTSSLPDLHETHTRQIQRYPPNPRTLFPAGPLHPLSMRPSEPDHPEKEDEEEKEPQMSRTAAVVLLLVTTGLVAACAEFMVDAIPAMISNSPVSEAFIGLIILPIVGNAAEHVTAVTVATKNKVDLAIGVAVGSSIQIALFVTPIIVLIGWIINSGMSLYFNLFETVSLFVTAFVINFLILDGRSNYLEGSLLIAAYVIIAVAAFFYPDSTDQSQLGGSSDDAVNNVKRMLPAMLNLL